MCLKRKFNINKEWGKCCIDLDELNEKECFYWLDKKTYKIITCYNHLFEEEKSKIDNDKEGRYVVLPQYISNARIRNL